MKNCILVSIMVAILQLCGCRTYNAEQAPVYELNLSRCNVFIGDLSTTNGLDQTTFGSEIEPNVSVPVVGK